MFTRVYIRAQILSLCSLSAAAGRELDARASSAQLTQPCDCVMGCDELLTTVSGPQQVPFNDMPRSKY